MKKNELNGGITVLICVMIIVIGLITGIVTFLNTKPDDNQFVVISYGDIQISGYVKKAKLKHDVWDIELRGGAKYKAPREIVIFCPDPFKTQPKENDNG